MPTIISQDTTWSGIIELNDTVQVATGVTLTIAAGSTLRKASWEHKLQISGKLNIDGNSENKVLIEAVPVEFTRVGQGEINIDNAVITDIERFIGSGGNGQVVISDSHFKNSSLELWYVIGNSIVQKSTFDNSFVYVNFLSRDNATLDISDNLFYGASEGASSDLYFDSATNDVRVSGNSFLNQRAAIINKDGNRTGETIDAQGNWFNTTNAAEIGERIYDYSDDLTAGRVNYSNFLLEPSANTPTVPTDGAITESTSVLSVLVEAGVLASGPVLLKDLVEVTTYQGQTVTSHTVEYAGILINYADIDALVTTVARDGEFTSEFRSEISSLAPSAASLKYQDLLALVGVASFDSTLIYIAGADGNYVG